ncbi:MAG: pirin family protein [Verrucomicrobiae bacterium]|nr:pirin family protein [Verrucomicrobiae bacterium]
MIRRRQSHERGHANHGWLDSHHTFSFADYFDPAHMGFRSLRVINEDRVSPGAGFGMHPHRDMEILTYVLEGSLAHKDSLGHGRTIHSGELQAMSAGTGILHSEFNASDADPVHFYQIWILPSQPGGLPRYAEWTPPQNAAEQTLTLLASPEGAGGSVALGQNARVSLLKLRPGGHLDHAIAEGAGVWLQVMRGNGALNGQHLAAGDGVAVEKEAKIIFTASTDTEALLFELA